LDHYGYKQAIVVFRPQDEVRSVYGGAETDEALSNWLQDRALPIVGEYNSDSAPLYKRKNLPTLKVWLDNVNWESNLKNTMYFVNRIKKVAKTLFEKVHFVVVNKKGNEQELQEFGHGSVAKDAAAVGIISSSGQKYKMTDSFSVENLQSFVNKFLDGSLKAYIKSDPIPAENDGPVTVVVGESFNDIVMDPTKDVLLEIYGKMKQYILLILTLSFFLCVFV